MSSSLSTDSNSEMSVTSTSSSTSSSSSGTSSTSSRNDETASVSSTSIAVNKYGLKNVSTVTLLIEQVVLFFDMKYVLDGIAVLDTFLVLLNVDDMVLFTIEWLQVDVSFNKLFTFTYTCYYGSLWYHQAHHIDAGSNEIHSFTTPITPSPATTTPSAPVQPNQATIQQPGAAATGAGTGAATSSTSKSRSVNLGASLKYFWRITLTSHERVAFIAIFAEICFLLVSHGFYYINLLVEITHTSNLLTSLRSCNYAALPSDADDMDAASLSLTLFFAVISLVVKMIDYIRHELPLFMALLTPWLNTGISVARMLRCWRLVARSEVLQEYVDSFIDVSL
jgi:hypothetical protein